MSSTAGDQDRYFHCPEFKITMPTQECSKRRRAAAKRKSSLSDTGGEHLIANRYMTKICAKCRIFEEVLSKSISKEEMLRSFETTPSQAPSSTHGMKSPMSVTGSLHTPFVGRGLRR